MKARGDATRPPLPGIDAAAARLFHGPIVRREPEDPREYADEPVRGYGRYASGSVHWLDVMQHRLDRRDERRQVVLDDRPGPTMVDRLVAVAQEIAEVGDTAPGQGGMERLQLVRNEAGSSEMISGQRSTARRRKRSCS